VQSQGFERGGVTELPTAQALAGEMALMPLSSPGMGGTLSRPAAGIVIMGLVSQ
jgi:hypothetical protein